MISSWLPKCIRLRMSSYSLWTALFFTILYLLAAIIIGIHMMVTADDDFLRTIYTIYYDGVIKSMCTGHGNLFIVLKLSDSYNHKSRNTSCYAWLAKK